MAFESLLQSGFKNDDDDENNNNRKGISFSCFFLISLLKAQKYDSYICFISPDLNWISD